MTVRGFSRKIDFQAIDNLTKIVSDVSSKQDGQTVEIAIIKERLFNLDKVLTKDNGQPSVMKRLNCCETKIAEVAEIQKTGKAVYNSRHTLVDYFIQFVFSLAGVVTGVIVAYKSLHP